MKIVVDIGHPAQVHLYRNFIKEMEGKGHEVLITSLDKDVALKLLDQYGFKYINLGSTGSTFFRKVISIPILDYKMYKAVKGFKPDLFLGCASIRGAHTAKLMGKPCVTFSDTEATIKEHILYLPFVDYVCTPSCFRRDFGRKQVRYDGYHELAYLHPSYFKPNPDVLNRLGVSRDEKFSILRFVSWQATHDIGYCGFSLDQKRLIIKRLEEEGKVFITSESPLEDEFKKYDLPCGANELLDVLHYAALLVTESQTVATEAALLGTPVVRFNSYVGKKDMGNFIELEEKYDIMYSFNNFDRAKEKIEELLVNANLKEEWQAKRERLLEDKIDVTKWMIDFVESHWN